MTTNQKVAVPCPAEPSTLVSPQLGEESAPKVLKECHRFPHFSSLEETLSHLVICMRDGETCFVLGFLCMYRMFITTQQVLDQLFKR